MADFFALTCPNCGGKLQITNDIERFSCGHCGVEHIVKRGGGIVSIAPIVNGIKRMQTGIDKTAAELSLVRLAKEIEDLKLQKETLLKKYRSKAITVSKLFVISFMTDLIKKKDGGKPLSIWTPDKNWYICRDRFSSLTSGDIEYIFREGINNAIKPGHQNYESVQEFLADLRYLLTNIQRTQEIETEINKLKQLVQS